MSKNGNREYKSDLFSMLMQEKPYALETYNAVNNSNYSDPDEIEIITLEHGVSLSIRNDAAFILDMNANYYEHQSTFNPNMPLRDLLYYAEDLRRWVETEKKNLYGMSKVLIPTPHFVVFYNGRDDIPDITTQKLSDLFHKPTEDPELEVKCSVININPGHNDDLLKKASALSGYMFLVELIRDYQKEMLLSDAIHQAIDECIQRGILRDFLARRRSEVEKAVTLDFTFERQLELTARDEREAGRLEGRLEGIEEQKVFTEQERKRADEEAARADAAEEELAKLREELAKYKAAANK